MNDVLNERRPWSCCRVGQGSSIIFEERVNLVCEVGR